MIDSDDSATAWGMYRAMGEQFAHGGNSAAMAWLLVRLLVEVEALREALSSPETPEAVRASYRAAYARTAVLSRHAAGPAGGTHKVLLRFFAENAKDDRFTPEMRMLARLGATEEERQAVREEMETVELYT